MLDVSYHVSQYQNIISELRSEIGRLKEKIVEGGGGRSSAHGGGSKNSKKQAEELRELRDGMVANFREQMKLRIQLMKIDTHILGLTMEFEKNNIIINEYETDKAKNKHDRAAASRRRVRRRSRGMIEGEEEEDGAGDRGSGTGEGQSGGGGGGAEGEAGEEADNEESGFEDESTDDQDGKKAATAAGAAVAAARSRRSRSGSPPNGSESSGKVDREGDVTLVLCSVRSLHLPFFAPLELKALFSWHGLMVVNREMVGLFCTLSHPSSHPVSKKDHHRRCNTNTYQR